MTATHALVVAISGCSSSGKTTLARLLRDIFPNTFILHEDDFYRPEEELPSRDGLLDWDCAEALDIPAMAESLAYIREHAAFPPTLNSKEDQNSVGKCPVPDDTIEAQKAKVAAAIPSSHSLRSSLRLCLLDGFLLYSPSMAAVQPSLDIKLFLRASHDRARARREARDGYVTLEGFWADPPGYVDKIVWPNYVEEHAWMFEGGDVEGKFREDVLDKEGIKFQKDAAVDADIVKTLEWTVDVILEKLKNCV
ncbi:P-loop containing nucleoside triphosphate hydrolase protein [Dactylonectria macrodidyma]|uniref:P-loop containing nucleoside triphosphate hydrolase protein n=1 Tax=Dactylonectria macrodidyma TaxID=307937 RepID=A0A9P9FGU1_9HYPO|nr:P-loop containing nucleoside triphosphate hydrolase protein [Dactylonectria macrodidyma]